MLRALVVDLVRSSRNLTHLKHGLHHCGSKRWGVTDVTHFSTFAFDCGVYFIAARAAYDEHIYVGGRRRRRSRKYSWVTVLLED